STNRPSVSTDRPFVSTDRSFVSTDRSNTPNVSAASTPIDANVGESSFVYLGGKIPIDASTLPNADLPIDPNMPDLEETSDTLPNDGIFNGAYDDDEDVGAVADFNNMDNTIAVSPIPTLRIHKDHPKGQILGDPTSAVQTRGKIQKASSAQQALTISQALQDESWVEAMQEELLQFKLQKVWVLVDLSYGKKVIGTKWVFRNKRDERSIVVKNKARLVAQGFRQEEGIDYDEVFAHVSRIEAIRLFLAFASYMGFTVYQMDVKSAFLYGTIEEEVYVHQPPVFVDPAHPNKAYKVIKALYGPHQAPRAWYETQFSFLMKNSFRRGTIDKTLFIKKNKSDIMLVQAYVDDIIFDSTKKSMCTEFEECMHKRFQMSSMGELTFFLGLQVKQQPDRIFISQDKYVADVLKKFDFLSIRTSTTPIETHILAVQKQTMFANSNIEQNMIDNEWHICVVKNPVYHSRTKHIKIRHHFIKDCYEKRLIDVLKIHTNSNVADLLTKGFDVTRFNFLVGINAGSLDLVSSSSWYIVAFFLFLHSLFRISMDLRMDRCSPDIYYSSMVYATGIHNLSDAEIYAGLATLGYVTEGDIVPLLPAMLAGAAVDQGEGSAQPAEPHHTPVDPISSTSQPPIPSPPHPSPPPHSPLQSPPHSPHQSPPFSPPHFSPPRSYEAPLPEGNTSGSAEDSMQLRELMVLVPTLVTRINSLEKELKDTKQTLGNVVVKLVKKVKSLEIALKRKSKKVLISESEGEEPEDQGRIIQDIDDDPLVSLVRESMKEKSTDFVTPTKASREAQEEEISPTILEAAKTLSKVASQGVSKEKSTDKGKRYRRRARSVAKNINIGLNAKEEINTGIKDVNNGSTKVDSGTASKRSQREGKAPMVEEDIQATHKTKEQMRQEEAGLEEAIKLQAQLDEEVSKQIHLDKMIQGRSKCRVDKDVLGKDLPEQDFAKRMVDMVNQRKKHFAEERAKEKRNKPMTQSQLRIYMSNYLKNQGTWKLSQLKKLKFEEIKEEFDKFDDKDVPAIGEKVVEVKEEEPVKRTGKRKKQKARKGINVDKSTQEDSETNKEELVEAINPTPLTTKSDIYMSFGAIVKDFIREDLIELYRLVIQKYGKHRHEDAYDRVLWSDLRTMFDPPLNKDAIWSLPLQQKMVSWRYYDKCEVHCLTLEACTIYMLADRKYPLSKDACQVMLKMKLLDGKINEVCYKLLKMIEKQAGIRK
ncbi:putative ribonuclease H-like domain-containing protein, partial [Tanacetum coccineum]